MRVLVLDDDVARLAAFKMRFPDAVLVKTADEAIAALKTGPVYDCVYLDHDLGPGGTGREVARYIASMSEHNFSAVIHSHNDVGAREMALTLIDAGVPVQVEPFRMSKHESEAVFGTFSLDE